MADIIEEPEVLAPLPRFPIHPNVTAENVLAAYVRQFTTLDDPGFCLACGVEAEGVEPDARRYRCAACGAPEVYGAEWIMAAELFAGGLAP